ncbi:MAG TPA: DJ-1/PfpI family protein [Tepidiformaceae bacterium]|nr:DJ-1/PfpI family protein [Tepidiformaceae bacterium]
MTRKIAFVLFDGAEELDFVGPWEVFTMLAQLEPGSCECYVVSEKGGEVKCAKGMRVVSDFSFAAAPSPDIFIVPGGRGTRIEKDNPAMLEWVRAAAASAEISTSVCTGALVLQSAGLLAGKQVTTHWRAVPELQALGDDFSIITGTRWVDEGDVVTAAGVSAGIDMSLHLVGRLWSPEIARNVQLRMEYFPAPPYQDVPLPETYPC